MMIGTVQRPVEIRHSSGGIFLDQPTWIRQDAVENEPENLPEDGTKIRYGDSLMFGRNKSSLDCSGKSGLFSFLNGWHDRSSRGFESSPFSSVTKPSEKVKKL